VIYRSDESVPAIAINCDLRLIGVRIKQMSLHDVSDLRPERFAIYHDQQQIARSADELLVLIHHEQRELSAYVNSLLGRLEMPPIASLTLSPPIDGAIWSSADLSLSDQQKAIWAWRAQQYKEQKGEITPCLFTITDILSDDPRI